MTKIPNFRVFTISPAKLRPFFTCHTLVTAEKKKSFPTPSLNTDGKKPLFTAVH